MSPAKEEEVGAVEKPKKAGSSEEDRKLLKLIEEGDENAFWCLWGKFKRKLFIRCLSWMNGDHADAEDALSDCMLKAQLRIVDYAGEIRNIEAWLTRLVYNHCIDQQRQRKRVQASGLDDSIHEHSWYRNSKAEPPEHQLINSEKTRSVFLFATELAPNLKKPFVLHFISQQSYTTIAELCGITVENVRKRIQMARDELKLKIRAMEAGRLSAPIGVKNQLETLLPSDPCFEVSAEAPLNYAFELKPTCAQLGEGILVTHHFFLPEKRALRSEKKLENLRKYVDLHPNGWKKRFQLAQYYEHNGGWLEAIGHYYAVLEKKPGKPDVSWQLAQILQVMGRFAESGKVLRDAANQKADSSGRFTFLGWAHFAEGDKEEAEGFLLKALDQAPSNLFAQYCLGLFYLAGKRYRKSYSCFSSVRKLKNNHLPTLNLVIESLKYMDDREMYRRELEWALDLHKTHPLLLKYRVDAHCLEWGDVEVSQKQIEKDLKLLLAQSPTPFYLESQCHYFLAKREPHRAIELFERFTKENPAMPAGFYYLARWYYRAKRDQDALKALQFGNGLKLLALKNRLLFYPTNRDQLEDALRVSPLLTQSVGFM